MMLTIIYVCSFLLSVLEPGVRRGPGAEAAAALQGVRHGAIHRGPGQTGQTMLHSFIKGSLKGLCSDTTEKYLLLFVG